MVCNVFFLKTFTHADQPDCLLSLVCNLDSVNSESVCIYCKPKSRVRSDSPHSDLIFERFRRSILVCRLCVHAQSLCVYIAKFLLLAASQLIGSVRKALSNFQNLQHAVRTMKNVPQTPRVVFLLAMIYVEACKLQVVLLLHIFHCEKWFHFFQKVEFRATHTSMTLGTAHWADLLLRITISNNRE